MLLSLIQWTIFGTLFCLGVGVKFSIAWALVIGILLGSCIPTLLAVNFLLSLRR